MQFSWLKERAAYLSQQAGWDQAFPAPDWSVFVNKALVDWSWDTEYNEEQITFTTTVNVPLYTLPTPYFKTIKDAAYQVSGQAPRILDRTTESDERKYDPLWFTRLAASPTRFAIVAPNVLRLVDMPANTGDVVVLRGTRVAPSLSLDTDTPSFPDTWHEALALRAAVLFCEPWATNDGATKVELYREQYNGMVAECKTYLAAERYSAIQRTIQRPSRRRAALSMYARRF